jgi:hypothetical protein
MPQALVLLNHLLHFFVLPLAWAALFCLAAQLVYPPQAQDRGKPWWQRWLRHWLMAGGLGCALSLVWLPINGGQSSMVYYCALGLLLVASEVLQSRRGRSTDE